jgi:hypothetical protein
LLIYQREKERFKHKLVNTNIIDQLIILWGKVLMHLEKNHQDISANIPGKTVKRCECFK